MSASWGVEVLGLRARGGSAEVHEGYQLGFERRVALKVIRSAPAAGDVRRRFEREARTLANLVHPNIVPIFDSGVFEDALVVMMPWYSSTLAEMITTRPLPPAKVRRLYEEMSQALGQAHSLGVVHRDVKPANIMVDDAGAFVIADFGIASVADETQITRTGSVPGTPSYLAPEVIQGARPTPAADLYALGATLFEAAAGTKVFAAEDPVSAAYQHVHGRVPKLEIPEDPELAEIIQRLLSKDPEERASSLQTLVRRSSRWPKIAALVAVLAIIGGGLASWLLRDEGAKARVGVFQGRLVALSGFDGCPKSPARRSVGSPGELATLAQVVTWDLESMPDGDAVLVFGDEEIEPRLNTQAGSRPSVSATIPPGLQALEGRLRYTDSDGVRREQRLVLPPPMSWAKLQVVQRGTTTSHLARATKSLRDGVFEGDPVLSSPGGLAVGEEGNSSVVVRMTSPAEVVFVGFVIDQGPRQQDLRKASQPANGSAYVRICSDAECGKASGLRSPDLAAKGKVGRETILDQAVGGEYLRIVWEAGSQGLDTRLHEVCALTRAAAA